MRRLYPATPYRVKRLCVFALLFHAFDADIGYARRRWAGERSNGGDKTMIMRTVAIGLAFAIVACKPAEPAAPAADVAVTTEAAPAPDVMAPAADAAAPAAAPDAMAAAPAADAGERHNSDPTKQ
jgi:hypothetical protein